MSTKNKPETARWYAVEAFTDGQEVKQVAEVKADGGVRPVLLQAQFYDANGNRVLQAVSVNMEAMPPSDLENLRRLLQAQGIVPTLILPDKAVRFMQLRPLSDVEARRLVAGIKQEIRAKQDKPDA